MAFRSRRKKLDPEAEAARKAELAAKRKAAAAEKRAAKKLEGPRVPNPEEALPDGTLLCAFTIPGRPATKKTHQNITWVGGRPRILPSSQFTAYEANCKQACLAAWADLGKAPMDFGVMLDIRVFLENWAGMGDHVGYLQSLCDILQEHRVLADDKWVHCGSDACCPPLPPHWFGTPDPGNARVEIRIVRFRHPYEEFRHAQEEEEAAKRQRAADRAAKAAEKAARANASPVSCTEPTNLHT